MSDKIQQPLPPNASTDLTQERQLLLDLFCELAYKEGDFVLSSGQRSSYYTNARRVAPCSPTF